MSRWKWAIAILVVLFVVAQLFRPHFVNPPVDPARALGANMNVPPNVASMLDRSCRDCHTNLTVLPWYSKFAPVSWLLANDINGGRHDMNLSDWASVPPARRAKLLQRLCKEVQGGDMPPWYYTIIHTNAKLSDADRKAICAWTASATPPGTTPAPTEAHDED